MKLRPHHLLCTQGYSGKGYDDEFTRHMTAVTDYLRNDPEAEIEIVCSTDDICSHCPNRKGIDLCTENAKVKNFDRKVACFFGIREQRYRYRDITEEIREKMTPLMMDEICMECSWYEVSNCRQSCVGKSAE